jgi:hypothetical protein
MLYIYITLSLLFIVLFTLSFFQNNIGAISTISFIAKGLGLLCSLGMIFVQGFNAFDTIWFPLCFSFEFTGFGASTLMNIAFFTVKRSKVDIPIFVLGALGAIGMIIISQLCY